MQDVQEATMSIVQRVKKAFESLQTIRSSIATDKNVVPPSKDQSHQWYNILLIGETGSGKTSFLNLLCFFNLIGEIGWDEALKRRLEVFNNVSLENNKADEMENATTAPSYYQFRFGDLNIGIVDTPGFGDTRGLEKDEQNVKNIVDKVNSVEYIHCICLVINGTVARMSFHLRYVITEISSILPKETVDNILVIFTNAQNNLKANFKLKNLTEFMGRDLPQSNAFYFDNPLCTLQKASELEFPKNIKNQFEDASYELLKMFSHLTEFEKIYSTAFMNLYHTKVAVERKTCELLLQVQYQDELESKLHKKHLEIENAVLTREKLYQDYVTIWRKTKTDRHNTLCAECNSNCHTPCSLDRTLDKEVLKGCYAMIHVLQGTLSR